MALVAASVVAGTCLYVALVFGVMSAAIWITQ